jgi:hypothetical protein
VVPTRSLMAASSQRTATLILTGGAPALGELVGILAIGEGEAVCPGMPGGRITQTRKRTAAILFFMVGSTLTLV